MFDFAKIRNPVLDRRPNAFVRDPAIILRDGLLRCFHTTAVENGDERRLHLEMSVTDDLIHWKTTRLLQSALNFSSPGNVIRVDDQWILCVQSYPINPGELWGNDQSRLWLMTSDDLDHWSEPDVMVEDGCACEWAGGPRQIDPYLVFHEGEYYCFYKANSCLGAVKSSDLKSWQEVSPKNPIVSHPDIPDRRAIENPCVVKDDDGSYVLFFSPCREGRGMGIARSNDLIHWRDFQYLKFPELPWAKNGPTAPAVIDARSETGQWLMVFHGESVESGHDAALGVAFSDDLIHWNVP